VGKRKKKGNEMTSTAMSVELVKRVATLLEQVTQGDGFLPGESHGKFWRAVTSPGVATAYATVLIAKLLLLETQSPDFYGTTRSLRDVVTLMIDGQWQPLPEVVLLSSQGAGSNTGGGGGGGSGGGGGGSGGANSGPLSAGGASGGLAAGSGSGITGSAGGAVGSGAGGMASGVATGGVGGTAAAGGGAAAAGAGGSMGGVASGGVAAQPVEGLLVPPRNHPLREFLISSLYYLSINFTLEPHPALSSLLSLWNSLRTSTSRCAMNEVGSCLFIYLFIFIFIFVFIFIFILLLLLLLLFLFISFIFLNQFVIGKLMF
jgi:hypothetical protein